MNFWEFLDRQIGRIKPTGVAGAGVFMLTGAILLIIVKNKDLADNDLFKTLAQAIVVQGLIGLAMAAWFTKNSNKVEIDQGRNNPVPTTDETQENDNA
jgi:hypothetical protein